MSRWKRLAACACCSLLLVLAGCGARHSADENYFLVSANIKVPYWEAAGAGFLRAAEQMKVKAQFVGPDNYDPQAQQQEFHRILGQKPTGILVSPANADLLKPEIDAAIAAGVPVITIDSDARDSKRLFFIGTNNYQAGLMGGKVAAERLKGRGSVVVFTMPGQTNLEERLRGYREAFASSQVKIDRIVDIKGDPRIAFDTATQIVGDKKSKIDGFVCLEALAGKEVANVVDRYKISGKLIMAMDTDSETLEWIRKGVIAATIAQKPYSMAAFGMRMLDSLYHDRLPSLQVDWAHDSFSPVPAFIDTGAMLIDKNNLEAFEAAQKSATQK